MTKNIWFQDGWTWRYIFNYKGNDYNFDIFPSILINNVFGITVYSTNQSALYYLYEPGKIIEHTYPRAFEVKYNNIEQAKSNVLFYIRWLNLQAFQ